MADRTRLQQQISLDPERAAWLREEAKRTDLTMSQLVRRALDEYRERHPMTPRTTREPYMGDHDYRRWFRAVWDEFNRATGLVDIPAEPDLSEMYRRGISIEEAAASLSAALPR